MFVVPTPIIASVIADAVRPKGVPMTPADFAALFSELTNGAQVLSPTATHVRRELGKLLADVVRLENEANRIVRTLQQLQPTPHDR